MVEVPDSLFFRKGFCKVLQQSLYILAAYTVIYYLGDRKTIYPAFFFYHTGFLLFIYFLFKFAFKKDLLKAKDHENTLPMAFLYPFFFLLISIYFSFLPVSSVYSKVTGYANSPLVTYSTYSNSCKWELGKIKFFSGPTHSKELLACNSSVENKINQIAIAFKWDKEDDRYDNFTFDEEYFLFDQTALFYGYNRLVLIEINEFSKAFHFFFFLLEHFIYAFVFSCIILLINYKGKRRVRNQLNVYS